MKSDTISINIQNVFPSNVQSNLSCPVQAMPGSLEGGRAESTSPGHKPLSVMPGHRLPGSHNCAGSALGSAAWFARTELTSNPSTSIINILREDAGGESSGSLFWKVHAVSWGLCLVRCHSDPLLATVLVSRMADDDEFRPEI